MTTKRFVYSSHALGQMHERNVSKALVEKCFATPDVIIPARKGRLCLIGNVRRNLVLKIFFRESANTIYIITTYFTDKK